MTRGANGAPVPQDVGGVVAAVAEGGPACRAGITTGEVILSVDGTPLRDVIDWRWLTAEGAFTARVTGEGAATRDVRVEPAWDEAPGVEFADLLFDGVRECENACEFCFVAQLPGGMRPSLYVRDDDFRLSFLSGNFVTLTNLDDDDIERILDQRLSPLHVSLHATDEDVRRTLVCATREDRALEHADRLLAGGIELHAQVVLVPGRNAGEVLQRTVGWLAAREGVVSVGVVPMGFTGHQGRYTASYGDPCAAGEVLDALRPWQDLMLAERGVPWVYAADELHLASGRGVPPAEDYGDFPQYENGVGMARTFVDAWTAEVAAAGPVGARGGTEVTLVTGELFGPVLRGLANDTSAALRVLAVPNRFFGGNVSVAGLLTAKDVADAIRADGPRGVYAVPEAILNTDDVTLDDVPAAELAAICGGDVRVVSSDAAGALAAIRALSGERGG